MLDRDLADLYKVETKVLNQAVKRNIECFPEHFRFQLTNQDKEELVTNCDRLNMLKYSSVNPNASPEYRLIFATVRFPVNFGRMQRGIMPGIPE